MVLEELNQDHELEVLVLHVYYQQLYNEDQSSLRICYAGLPYGQNGQLPRAPRSRGPALTGGVSENQRKRVKKEKSKKEKRTEER